MKNSSSFRRQIVKICLTFFCLAYVAINSKVNAQNVAVTDDDSYVANPSAMLDIKSTTKGMLIPRLTSSERTSIETPAIGLLVFDTELNSFMYFNGANWITIPQMSTAASNDEALFAVINAAGDTVFAVYNDGAKVVVPYGTKGKVGGFAVSGRTSTKAGEEEYLKVTPDSTRIFINENDVKGRIGGFAVSGRTSTKDAIIKDYFVSTSDSTRIFIDTTSAKGRVGGFAVSGRTTTKGGIKPNDYFNISGNSELDSIESEARILWYPVKAAFLAGEVHIGSADSVGTNSTSLGYRTIAMGNYSQAMGYKAQSLGLNSTAIGNSAIAKSNNSFAFGNNAQTQGLNSFAFGDSAISNGENSYALGSHAKALGKNSFAMGSFGFDKEGFLTGPTVASGDYSYALGMGSQATGRISLAFGGINNATGEHSIAIGYGTTASALNSFAFGLRNTASGGSSFALGNYTNATGIFSTTLGNATSATGLNSTAMGFETTANGDYSHTLGRKLWANGDHSIAIGSFSTADGAASLALGNYTYASGIFSTTMGNATTASGLNATAMGFSSKASGSYSTVIGSQVKANSYASLVVGMFNDTTSNSSTAWVATDPLFIIGNGSADNARSNALTVLKNGRIGIGTVSPNEKLHVIGNIKVEGNIYYPTNMIPKPDYVFSTSYNKYLDPLKVEEFIKTNGHLPWMTSANGELDGVNLTRMQFETLETVENLQLQIIELKKENQDIISKQQSEIDNLKAELEAIKAALRSEK